MKDRHTISISLRLTAWFCVIFLAGYALFGGAMWLVLKRTLTGERRQTLTRRMDRIEDLLRKDAGASEADRQADLKDFAAATGNGLIDVLEADGTRQTPAPSAAARGFAWPDAAHLSQERFVHVFSHGQPYWVLERPYTAGTQPAVLLAAAPESGNLLLLESFLRGLLAAAPLLLLISMAGGYWTSRRALRPVDRITAAARSISIRNLSERLPVVQSGDELQRLAETCNDMLERLEIAVRRLRQFTADASHELRGPLSLTRTIAEVSLRSRQTDAASRRALEEIVDEAAHAGALLEQMLELARADTEPVDLVLTPIDLALLLEEGCAQARLIAQARDVVITFTPPAEPVPPVTGHTPSIRRLLWILLDNAMKYTPAGGRIDVSLQAVADTVEVRVRDTGIGIAPAHLPYIFDRFYRADPSRSQVEGSGLGLSIAHWIARTHHAQILAESEEDKGSTFRVLFHTE